jgi:glutamine synthetase
MANIVAEYVWIDGDRNLRSKARTLSIDGGLFTGLLHNTGSINSILPDWNYDGSSTKQAEGKFSEIILKPRFCVRCPFRRWKEEHQNVRGERTRPNGDICNILVMCDTYEPNGKPALNNNRKWADDIFNKDLDASPWYGLEQEFFIMTADGKPVGYTDDVIAKGQGQFYCSVGSQNAFGRAAIDDMYEHCLYAGLNISGVNAEVALGQWEYQIGPSLGINAGDELYLSRYILQRIAEKYSVSIDFEPKPLSGNWNGSGCHTNYSTKAMREGTVKKTGLEYIHEAIEKLSLKHTEHMELYGTGNELRMTGEHETSSYDIFTSGCGNRGASVRIPTQTEKDKKGYFEDRRPSSNMDPYLVTGVIFRTTVVDSEEAAPSPKDVK